MTSAFERQVPHHHAMYIALALCDPASELAAVKSCLPSLQLWFYGFKL